MVRYREAGTELALAMNNRGPVRFEADGRLDQSILDAYSEHVFYILEGALLADDLADVEADLIDILGRLPSGRVTLDRRRSGRHQGQQPSGPRYFGIEPE